MKDNQDPVLILASAINNLAEAIHRHADLQMQEDESDDGDEFERDTDMAGRPVKVK